MLLIGLILAALTGLGNGQACPAVPNVARICNSVTYTGARVLMDTSSYSETAVNCSCTFSTTADTIRIMTYAAPNNQQCNSAIRLYSSSGNAMRFQCLMSGTYLDTSVHKTGGAEFETYGTPYDKNYCLVIEHMGTTTDSITLSCNGKEETPSTTTVSEVTTVGLDITATTSEYVDLTTGPELFSVPASIRVNNEIPAVETHEKNVNRSTAIDGVMTNFTNESGWNTSSTTEEFAKFNGSTTNDTNEINPAGITDLYTTVSPGTHNTWDDNSLSQNQKFNEMQNTTEILKLQTFKALNDTRLVTGRSEFTTISTANNQDGVNDTYIERASLSIPEPDKSSRRFATLVIDDRSRESDTIVPITSDRSAMTDAMLPSTKLPSIVLDLNETQTFGNDTVRPGRSNFGKDALQTERASFGNDAIISNVNDNIMPERTSFGNDGLQPERVTFGNDAIMSQGTTEAHKFDIMFESDAVRQNTTTEQPNFVTTELSSSFGNGSLTLEVSRNNVSSSVGDRSLVDETDQTPNNIHHTSDRQSNGLLLVPNPVESSTTFQNGDLSLENDTLWNMGIPGQSSILLTEPTATFGNDAVGKSAVTEHPLPDKEVSFGSDSFSNPVFTTKQTSPPMIDSSPGNDVVGLSTDAVPIEPSTFGFDLIPKQVITSSGPANTTETSVDEIFPKEEFTTSTTLVTANVKRTIGAEIQSNNTTSNLIDALRNDSLALAEHANIHDVLSNVQPLEFQHERGVDNLVLRNTFGPDVISKERATFGPDAKTMGESVRTGPRSGAIVKNNILLSTFGPDVISRERTTFGPDALLKDSEIRRSFGADVIARDNIIPSTLGPDVVSKERVTFEPDAILKDIVTRQTFGADAITRENIIPSATFGPDVFSKERGTFGQDGIVKETENRQEFGFDTFARNNMVPAALKSDVMPKDRATFGPDAILKDTVTRQMFDSDAIARENMVPTALGPDVLPTERATFRPDAIVKDTATRQTFGTDTIEGENMMTGSFGLDVVSKETATFGPDSLLKDTVTRQKFGADAVATDNAIPKSTFGPDIVTKERAAFGPDAILKDTVTRQMFGSDAIARENMVPTAFGPDGMPIERATFRPDAIVKDTETRQIFGTDTIEGENMMIGSFGLDVVSKETATFGPVTLLKDTVTRQKFGADAVATDNAIPKSTFGPDIVTKERATFGPDAILKDTITRQMFGADTSARENMVPTALRPDVLQTERATFRPDAIVKDTATRQTFGTDTIEGENMMIGSFGLDVVSKEIATFGPDTLLKDTVMRQNFGADAIATDNVVSGSTFGPDVVTKERATFGPDAILKDTVTRQMFGADSSARNHLVPTTIRPDVMPKERATVGSDAILKGTETRQSFGSSVIARDTAISNTFGPDVVSTERATFGPDSIRKGDVNRQTFGADVITRDNLMPPGTTFGPDVVSKQRATFGPDAVGKDLAADLGVGSELHIRENMLLDNTISKERVTFGHDGNEKDTVTRPSFGSDAIAKNTLMGNNFKSNETMSVLKHSEKGSDGNLVMKSIIGQDITSEEMTTFGQDGIPKGNMTSLSLLQSTIRPDVILKERATFGSDEIRKDTLNGLHLGSDTSSKEKLLHNTIGPDVITTERASFGSDAIQNDEVSSPSQRATFGGNIHEKDAGSSLLAVLKKESLLISTRAARGQDILQNNDTQDFTQHTDDFPFGSDVLSKERTTFGPDAIQSDLSFGTNFGSDTIPKKSVLAAESTTVEQPFGSDAFPKWRSTFAPISLENSASLIHNDILTETNSANPKTVVREFVATVGLDNVENVTDSRIVTNTVTDGVLFGNEAISRNQITELTAFSKDVTQKEQTSANPVPTTDTLKDSSMREIFGDFAGRRQLFTTTEVAHTTNNVVNSILLDSIADNPEKKLNIHSHESSSPIPNIDNTNRIEVGTTTTDNSRIDEPVIEEIVPRKIDTSLLSSIKDVLPEQAGDVIADVHNDSITTIDVNIIQTTATSDVTTPDKSKESFGMDAILPSFNTTAASFEKSTLAQESTTTNEAKSSIEVQSTTTRGSQKFSTVKQTTIGYATVKTTLPDIIPASREVIDSGVPRREIVHEIPTTQQPIRTTKKMYDVMVAETALTNDRNSIGDRSKTRSSKDQLNVSLEDEPDDSFFDMNNKTYIIIVIAAAGFIVMVAVIAVIIRNRKKAHSAKADINNGVTSSNHSNAAFDNGASDAERGNLANTTNGVDVPKPIVEVIEPQVNGTDHKTVGDS